MPRGDKGDVVRTVKLLCVIVMRRSHHFLSVADSPSCISCKQPLPQTAAALATAALIHRSPASAGARSAVLRFRGKPKRFLKEKDLGESALVVWGVVAARRGVDAARPPGVKSLGLPPASLRPLRARRGVLVVWGTPFKVVPKYR